MRLVLLGFPGAGKGTQGELLGERFGVPHISTGVIFRAAIDSDTPLGREAQAFIARGELVPDDLAVRIVKERIQQPDARRGFILDGFPRTVAQAKILDGVLADLHMDLDGAVDIRITPEAAIQRVAGRRICSQCGHTYHRMWVPAKGEGVCDICGGPLIQRADDTEETARRRLEVYLSQTRPVVDYYEARGILVAVDGEQPIPQVFEDILRGLQAVTTSEGQG